MKERTEDMFVSGGENVPAEIKEAAARGRGIRRPCSARPTPAGRRPVAFVERESARAARDDRYAQRTQRRRRDQLASLTNRQLASYVRTSGAPVETVLRHVARR
ncbi:MAG: hypothetical protein ACLT98_14680 [Eggerthellaceae bacterium]